jgi:shikimate dehydrogenase
MRKFGLIGYPLGHSFSKKYFEAKFEKEGIKDCLYDLYEIEDITLFPKIVKENPELIGMNVTIPYKEKVIPYLDQLDPACQKIGAVNTIQFLNGKTIGHNTDVIGFEKSLLPLLKNHHQNALILGTGGAAKAVQFVLEKLNISFKYVSRKKAKEHLLYTDLNEEIIEKYTLIINTTPLGMFPKIDNLPNLPYQFISKKHLVYDLIYNPLETAFLQKAKAQGATIKNGLEMLQIQAEESWKIWNL